MLVVLYGQWRLFAALRYRNGQDLVLEEAFLAGRLVTGLTLRGKAIHFQSAQVKFARNVVCGFRHGVRTELTFDQRVREARANGAVKGPEFTTVR